MLKTLEGVRVIDFGMAAAGPSATKILSEFGAEVIVVEPLQGTSTRWMTNTYDYWSDGKKSVPLDAKSEEGREVLLRLVASADVFASNFRAKALQKLGLTYEDLKKVNPEIIYAVTYGWGAKGPLKDDAAYDITAFFARGGYLRDMAEKGSICVPPQGMADASLGEILSAGICAALFRKLKTGKGCELSTSLFAQACYLDNFQSANIQLGEDAFQKTRTAPREALCNTYKCADGEYIIMFDNQFDRHFWNIMKAIGREDLVGDKRWTNIDDTKFDKAPELVAILEEAFSKMTAEEAVAALKSVDVAVEKCASYVDKVTDPQAIANDYVFDWKLTSGKYEGKTIKLVATPIAFNGENCVSDYKRAPRLGEHTVEALKSVGYSDEEIKKLADDKKIFIEEK